MKKKLLPLAVALVGGGVGFALRRWQLAAGFEPETGLAIQWAPSTVALVAWSCLMAAALAALLWRMPHMPQRVDEAFPAQGKPIFLTACVLGGFLLLVSGGVEAVTLSASGGSSLWTDWGAALLPLMRIALSVLGCLSVLFWTQRLSRKDERVHESLAILELCLLFCVWLISDFRTRAIDPITQNYLYEVLAIVCALMGLYYLAGYSFQIGKPRRTVWFCLLGVCFSLVTLADGHGLADVCRYGFIILFLTAHAALLLVAPEETAEEKTEAENNG